MPYFTIYMGNIPKFPDATILVQDSLDFGYSISKFIKYCEHLVLELDSGKDFSDEGFRGNGYTAILLKQLKTEEDNIITLDTVINVLYELLLTDFFDENLPLFSHVYGQFRRLIKFSESDKDYSKSIQELRLKGEKLYSGSYQDLLAPPIHEFQGSIQKRMRDCVSSFIDLCDFLKILANDPGNIYVGKDKEHLHPQYQNLHDSFETLRDQYEKWELLRYDESIKTGKGYNAERVNDHDIIEWYEKLTELPIEQAVQVFAIYLLKSGEFDILTNRDEVKNNLLQLSKKVGTDREQEVRLYEFRESSEYVDTELEFETGKVLDILLNGSYKSNSHQNTTLDDYLNLLGRRHILSHDELIEAISTDDIEDTLHSILSYKIMGGNKISTPSVRKKCINFCEAYAKKIQIETRTKIDLLLDEDREKLDDQGIEELPEDELLWLLDTGLNILKNFRKSHGELYHYDALALIELAQEEDIIRDDIAEELSLGDDSGYIIYKILEAVIDNDYLGEIGRDDLKEDFQRHLYSLNMLFTN